MSRVVKLPPIPAGKRVTTLAPAFFASAIGPYLDTFRDADWPDRVDQVERWLGRNVVLKADLSPSVHRDSGVRLRTVLTALLESATVVEIDCLDAAMLVHLSIHTDWRLAACKWLRRASEDRQDQWMYDHPSILAILVFTTSGKAEHA